MSFESDSKALRSFADFSEGISEGLAQHQMGTEENKYENEKSSDIKGTTKEISQLASGIGMNLSYTINLNLPETKDPEVFDAIFSALKEKLLK